MHATFLRRAGMQGQCIWPSTRSASTSRRSRDPRGREEHHLHRKALCAIEGSEETIRHGAPLVATPRRDYHNHLRRKLRSCTVSSLSRARYEGRPCPTWSPFSSAWWARCRLGFVGKNGLVSCRAGSFVLLGVVTTLDSPPDTPMTERCGSCTRCLDACQRTLFQRLSCSIRANASAYHTIESPIRAESYAAMGEHLFGCDDCQTVCPSIGPSTGCIHDAAVRPHRSGAKWDASPSYRPTTLGSAHLRPAGERERVEGSRKRAPRCCTALSRSATGMQTPRAKSLERLRYGSSVSSSVSRGRREPHPFLAMLARSELTRSIVT